MTFSLRHLKVEVTMIKTLINNKMFLLVFNFSALGRTVNNPLEQFEINDFLYLLAPIFGFTKLSLTNIGFYLILVVFIVLTLNLLASNHYSLIPSRWSISQESLYGSVLNLVREQIGPANEIYVPFIFALFHLILVGNLVGFVPYSFTITSQFVLPIALSVSILIGVTIIGFQRHGIGFFALFIPSGAPLGLVPLLVVLELISYLARGLSLGLRLAGNMIAGHTLLKIISTFAWGAIISGTSAAFLGVFGIVILFLFCVLELGIALFQAYIFTLLTCLYINDAINLHG
jgi:F-type H+-transporting ATPase subunit a